MANSRFEYVKQFELPDALLPGCWIVVRIDGRGFTKFSASHNFAKPNDINALHLMNKAAMEVMAELPDIVFAFGVSDEFSFVVKKSSNLYQRRSSKVTSAIVSLFSASYVHNWPSFFPSLALKSLPSFDARAVCYPSDATLRDYLSWRQVDCHINNQYNTCFWELVKSGVSKSEAQDQIKGTNANFKNELLFTKFGINYNNLPEIFRKGSLIFRHVVMEEVKRDHESTLVTRVRRKLEVSHVDLIEDSFWNEHPGILN